LEATDNILYTPLKFQYAFELITIILYFIYSHILRIRHYRQKMAGIILHIEKKGWTDEEFTELEILSSCLKIDFRNPFEEGYVSKYFR
jgi:hypothetical protein